MSKNTADMTDWTLSGDGLSYQNPKGFTIVRSYKGGDNWHLFREVDENGVGSEDAVMSGTLVACKNFAGYLS